MPTPHSYLTATEENALALDGLSQRHGTMCWPSPFPPLLRERAQMVSRIIPSWAVARAITAGWVWTGIGRAEPWSLYAPKVPAVPPLSRTQWKPRVTAIESLDLRQIDRLTLLSPRATARDLLTAEVADDVAASQLFLLSNEELLEDLLSSISAEQRLSARAQLRGHLVREWWKAHPEVTR